METLNEFIDAGEGFLVAKMPVNASVHQPMGLHGGASVAESVKCSFFFLLMTKNKKYVELKYRQIMKHSRRSLLVQLNYSQRKNVASVGNKSYEEGI
jgi:hypothetical protein